MNERIRELLEQAGVHYVVMPKDTVYEKFAELILAECIDICKKHPSILASNNWNGTVVAPDIALRLEKHFGVEE